jgi:hypothetical protein
LPKGWTVPRDWAGETVAILASGPSMTLEQAEAVKGRCRVIAVNNQGIDTEADGKVIPAFAPWADVLYAADSKWWAANKPQALAFAGLKVTIRGSIVPEIEFLLQSHERIFDPRPTHLATGGNSGYQAVHLAVHFGAARIVLLGFDMQATGNRRHWFGNHPKHLNTIQNFGAWVQAFDRLAPVLADRGVDVVNCTPTSALKCFRVDRLAAVL